MEQMWSLTAVDRDKDRCLRFI